MTDQSQGPGWWRASDDKWYPPESHPGVPAGLPPAPAAATPTDAKGFLKSLYDFQFDHFITPKLIRVFYAISVVVLSLGAALMLIASLASGESSGVLLGLFVVPIGYLLYLIFTRMYFELVAAFFRMADDLHELRHRKES